MSGRPFLVITGMHRSNTSMLGRILASAGVELGSRLVGPDPSNPYGHYEDEELMLLHEDILRANGSSWHPWFRKRFTVPDTYDRKLHSIVEDRRDGCKGIWGFKVPHATLFLDTWAQFSEAKFIFIFRDPESVLRSLMRRAGGQIYLKPYFALNCLLTYVLYNRAIIEFFRQNDRRSYLANSEHVVAMPRAVVQDIGQKLALSPLRTVDDGLVDRSIIGRKGGLYVDTLAKCLSKHKAARQCFELLNQMSDTSGLNPARQQVA